MEFIVFSPPYSETNGGAIVLHKLCHILNTIGHRAYLYPAYQPQILGQGEFIKPVFKILQSYLSRRLRVYKTNSAFHTPIFPISGRVDDRFVVIYPEIIRGNPLRSNHVVRWLLHKPGFHNSSVYYGTGEIYYDFDNFSAEFSIPGSFLSKNKLFVSHMPTNIYNSDGALPTDQRSGTAYCLRKGRGRPIVHDLNDSILIDGMTHLDIAAVFKRIKTFISYDCHTAYTVFAALCGADVVVIPLEGVTKEQWYPNEVRRYGLAYGFDDLEWARKTRTLLMDSIIQEETRAEARVRQFVDEVAVHFKISSVGFELNGIR